jgi:hypothetical protein
MKQQNEFYAIAKKGTNRFLTEYKNNERALTYSAKYTKDIRCALIFEKSDDETYEAIQNIAKALGGRLVKVKAEYEIMEEDGSELEEISADEEKEEKRRFLSDLLGL